MFKISCHFLYPNPSIIIIDAGTGILIGYDDQKMVNTMIHHEFTFCEDKHYEITLERDTELTLTRFIITKIEEVIYHESKLEAKKKIERYNANN